MWCLDAKVTSCPRGAVTRSVLGSSCYHLPMTDTWLFGSHLEGRETENTEGLGGGVSLRLGVGTTMNSTFQEDSPSCSMNMDRPIQMT